MLHSQISQGQSSKKRIIRKLDFWIRNVEKNTKLRLIKVNIRVIQAWIFWNWSWFKTKPKYIFKALNANNTQIYKCLIYACLIVNFKILEGAFGVPVSRRSGGGLATLKVSCLNRHSKQLSLNKFFDPTTPSLLGGDHGWPSLVGDHPRVSGRRGLGWGVPLGFWAF